MAAAHLQHLPHLLRARLRGNEQLLALLEVGMDVLGKLLRLGKERLRQLRRALGGRFVCCKFKIIIRTTNNRNIIIIINAINNK